MSTIQLKKKKYPSLFNKLHLNNLNISNDSYHEVIDNYSDTIVKFFEKNREFKEIIPDIKKGKRANFLYKRLVYKGMQFQSPFMKALMKMVKEYEKKNKVEIAKREFTGLYKLSNLDLIKLKLEKLERFKRIKLKDINVKNDEPNSTNNLKRSFSNFSLNMTPKTQKFNLNSSLILSILIMKKMKEQVNNIEIIQIGYLILSLHIYIIYLVKIIFQIKDQNQPK